MARADPRSESRIAAAEKEIEDLGSRIRELTSELEELREHRDAGEALADPILTPISGIRTIRVQETRRTVVNRQSPPEEKIAVFRTLFAGRDDVYATRWVSAKTGRSGWSPAVRGGFYTDAVTDSDLLPLTDQVIDQHLRNNEPVQLRQILPRPRHASAQIIWSNGTRESHRATASGNVPCKGDNGLRGPGDLGVFRRPICFSLKRHPPLTRGCHRFCVEVASGENRPGRVHWHTASQAISNSRLANYNGCNTPRRRHHHAQLDHRDTDGGAPVRCARRVEARRFVAKPRILPPTGSTIQYIRYPEIRVLLRARRYSNPCAPRLARLGTTDSVISAHWRVDRQRNRGRPCHHANLSQRLEPRSARCGRRHATTRDRGARRSTRVRQDRDGLRDNSRTSGIDSHHRQQSRISDAVARASDRIPGHRPETDWTAKGTSARVGNDV